MNTRYCRICSRAFEGKEINVAAGVAACASCGAIERLVSPAIAPAEPRPVLAGHQTGTAKFKVEDSANRFVISWRWRSWRVLTHALSACLFVGGTLTVFEKPGFLHSAGLVCVSLWSAYTIAAELLNSTYITLEEGVFSVTHGPVLWLGAARRRCQDVAQLYAQEDGSFRRGSTYSLNAVLHDRRRVSLLRGLTNRDEALWLERTLETRLKLVDAPVHGELVK